MFIAPPLSFSVSLASSRPFNFAVNSALISAYFLSSSAVFSLTFFPHLPFFLRLPLAFFVVLILRTFFQGRYVSSLFLSPFFLFPTQSVSFIYSL